MSEFQESRIRRRTLIYAIILVSLIAEDCGYCYLAVERVTP